MVSLSNNCLECRSKRYPLNQTIQKSFLQRTLNSYRLLNSPYRHQIRRLNVTSCDDRNVIRASISAHWRIELSFTIPKLYLNFLSLVQFLPLFSFYSFNYTVKSGGVCNRLPVLCWDTRMLPSRQHQHYPRIPRIPYITLFRLHISLPFYLVTYTFLMYIYHLISIDLE